MNEQRTNERFNLCCLVTFREGRGLSRDISTTGIYFSTKKVLKESEMIQLTIHLNQEPSVQCEGKVVRTEQQTDDYGVADPAGRACVLPNIGEERIVTSVDVTIFRPPARMADRVYLANVFSTTEWFRAVSDRSGGTTHKRISRSALGNISIKLPPLPEQTAIATVLSDMDAELAALEARRYKTRALKQGMMQELLNGRIRLV